MRVFLKRGGNSVRVFANFMMGPIGLCSLPPRAKSAFAALVLLLASAYALSSPTLPPSVDLGSVAIIDTAQFCGAEGVTEKIPVTNCTWEPTVLPKEWRGHQGHELVDAWFKIPFRLTKLPTDGLAVFATAFNRSGKVFVNSIELRAVGPMTDPLPLNWNRAQYFVLPPSMLRIGDNELEIQQRVHSWEPGTLSKLRLGSEDDVRPLWERRVLWQNDAVEILGAITGALGLVMLGVWLLRRSEASYFWFGCACWVWTLGNLDYFVAYAPLPAESWEKLVLAAQVLRVAIMYMFILRYSGRRMPKVEAMIWTYFAAGAVGLTFGPFSGDWITLWFLGPLFTTPYFAFLLVREGLRRNLFEGALLCLAVTTEFCLSWYDIWLYQAAVPEPIFLAHYSTPLYVTVVGLSLIRHFVSSLSGYEKQYALTMGALDEANQATKEKNLFFSMVSHELKSPIQSIVTVLATEDKRADGHERRHSLKKIGRAVKLMEAQIRDLFVLSVGETAMLEMRSETFEVGELVEEVLVSVLDLAAAKALEISVAPRDDYLFVATDPKRVEQILLNLVENAIKYTLVGTVRIDYDLEGQDLLRIRVIDTGAGIAREHIGKLFVPYRRFGLLEREHNSLGIGLAVVQTLLKHLGGTCEVESTLGVGSTFTVRIPVAVEREHVSAQNTEDAVRLLIVDDRPEMLADLSEVAQTLGYHVDTAAAAPQALNELAVSAFDIVLIDLDMPVKNGLELASEIRRSGGLNEATCLVAISAGSPELLHGSMGLWPFDSFEQKPIDARAMRRIVEARTRYRPI